MQWTEALRRGTVLLTCVCVCVYTCVCVQIFEQEGAPSGALTFARAALQLCSKDQASAAATTGDDNAMMTDERPSASSGAGKARLWSNIFTYCCALKQWNEAYDAVVSVVSRTLFSMHHKAPYRALCEVRAHRMVVVSLFCLCRACVGVGGSVCMCVCLHVATGQQPGRATVPRLSQTSHPRAVRSQPDGLTVLAAAGWRAAAAGCPQRRRQGCSCSCSWLRWCAGDIG